MLCPPSGRFASDSGVCLVSESWQFKSPSFWRHYTSTTLLIPPKTGRREGMDFAESKEWNEGRRLEKGVSRLSSDVLPGEPKETALSAGQMLLTLEH